MAKQNVVLRLDGDISEMSAKILREQIEKAPQNKRIELRIASPGGSIFDGKTLLVALQAHEGGVDTVNESLAASMASALFMLGERRTMAQGSRLMIHRPWVSNMGGESNDLRKQADLLDSLEADLLAAYGRTGIGEAQLKQMMADETWMTADEAHALGFATEISGQLRGAIPESYLNKFEHVPADLKEEAVADVADVVIPTPQTKSSLQARVNNLVSELNLRTTERDKARDQLAKTKFLLAALERSYGIGVAEQVIVTPRDEMEDVLVTFESLTGEERSRYYREHKAEIQHAHNVKRFGV